MLPDDDPLDEWIALGIVVVLLVTAFILWWLP